MANTSVFKDGVVDTILSNMDTLLDSSEADLITINITTSSNKTITLTISKD